MTLADLQSAFGDGAPYIALILFGFLPSEFWRWLAVIMAKDLKPEAEILVFVRAVATALLAGVVAKILLVPPGALAQVPGQARLAAMLAGFAAYAFFGRSVLAGIAAGVGFLIAAAWVLGPS